MQKLSFADQLAAAAAAKGIDLTTVQTLEVTVEQTPAPATASAPVVTIATSDAEAIAQGVAKPMDVTWTTLFEIDNVQVAVSSYPHWRESEYLRRQGLDWQYREWFAATKGKTKVLFCGYDMSATVPEGAKIIGNIKVMERERDGERQIVVNVKVLADQSGTPVNQLRVHSVGAQFKRKDGITLFDREVPGSDGVVEVCKYVPKPPHVPKNKQTPPAE